MVQQSHEVKGKVNRGEIFFMAEERRINLRVSPAEYEALDRKRFEERTSFQEVGLGLLRAWLHGEKKPEPVQPECDPDVENLRELKRIGEPHRVAALRENIVVFLENARRALAARKRKGA